MYAFRRYPVRGLVPMSLFLCLALGDDLGFLASRYYGCLLLFALFCLLGLFLLILFLLVLFFLILFHHLLVKENLAKGVLDRLRVMGMYERLVLDNL